MAFSPRNVSGVILALAILGLGTGIGRGDPFEPLFAQATEAQRARQKAGPVLEDAFIRRSRHVQVALELLEADRPVVLNLFSGVSLRAAGARANLGPGGRYTWRGQIEGVEQSRVILVVHEGDVVGNISLPGASYQIRPAGDGVHLVREVDLAAFPAEAEPWPAGLPAEGAAVPRESGGAGDDGAQIDVFVVYTAAAANAAANIEAQIQLSIEETNSSYADSQIAQRLNLIGIAEVDYAGSHDVFLDLERLTNPTDGFLDEVHALRDQSCADLVSLWVEYDPDWCGVAWLMTAVSSASASWGFSVVRRSCATGNLTLGHELGHNMGAHHDRYVDPEDGAFPYSHGYINYDDRWRTIMAYNTLCRDAGYSCTRIPYWSNPEVLYGGDPTGIPWDDPDSADNALTLDNTAVAVANFRPSAQCCALADPNEPDADCDGALDDTDACTVRSPWAQNAFRPVVLLKRLDRPPGERALLVKGYFNPATLIPDLEPDVNGAHFLLTDANGILFEVNIPGGAPADPPASHCGAKDGWTRKDPLSGRTSWTYKNRSGALPPNCEDPTSADGISRVILRDLTSTSKGAFQYVVRAKGSALTRTPGLPIQQLQADLALGAQAPSGSASAAAIAGQCAETAFPTPSPVPPKPYCKSIFRGVTLAKVLCKGL